MPTEDQKDRVAVETPSDAGTPRSLPPARVRVRVRAPALPAQPDGAAEAPEAPQKGEYEVGYGKPPKHTQFKRGNNANPKGRPPKSKSFWAMLDEEMNTPVTARVDGQNIKMTARTAAVKRLVAKVVNGDMKALELWIKYEQLKSADGREEAQELPLTDKEKAVLDAFEARIRGDEGGQGGDEP